MEKKYKTTEAQRRAVRKYFKTPKGKQKMYEAIHRYHHIAKREVLTHYGGGKLACVRCGEGDINCLTIDHIEAIRGARKANAGCFYEGLRKTKYPKGYQTLCMNCQWRKRAEQREYRFR